MVVRLLSNSKSGFDSSPGIQNSPLVNFFISTAFAQFQWKTYYLILTFRMLHITSHSTSIVYSSWYSWNTAWHYTLFYQSIHRVLIISAENNTMYLYSHINLLTCHMIVHIYVRNSCFTSNLWCPVVALDDGLLKVTLFLVDYSSYEKESIQNFVVYQYV